MIYVCVIVMGLGIVIGGWCIIKMMGFKVVDFKLVDGFVVEMSVVLIIDGVFSLGILVSIIYIILSVIMGVGIIKGFRKVKW